MNKTCLKCDTLLSSTSKGFCKLHRPLTSRKEIIEGVKVKKPIGKIKLSPTGVCLLKIHRRCHGYTFHGQKGCYWCNLAKDRPSKSPKYQVADAKEEPEELPPKK